MAKAGDEYQEVVAEVQRALDPGATVKVGQWIEGPDGRRELDVEVRGTRDGRPFFTTIECKDWATPVGIKAVDELDSKRLDVGADAAIIFSNSGFTRPAIRKATRKGIGCASAVIAGDQRIRVLIEREFVAKSLSVDRWSLEVFFSKDRPIDLPEEWDCRNLMHQGLPVVNWLHEVSLDLLRAHEGPSEIVAVYAFKEPSVFGLPGIELILTGIRLRLWCNRKWLSQRISVDVTRGFYDYITSRVIGPNAQSYILGPFDQQGWHEIEPPSVEELELGTFDLGMTLLNPIHNSPDDRKPDIESLISESKIGIAPLETYTVHPGLRISS